MSGPDPSLSAADLMRQASMTAHEYLIHARNSVRDLIGDDVAAHPEIVSALVLAAASDFHTAVIAQQLGALDELAEAISNRSDDLTPAVSDGLRGIAVAMEGVANSIETWLQER